MEKYCHHIIHMEKTASPWVSTITKADSNYLSPTFSSNIDFNLGEAQYCETQ